jgi:TP901 family phage tail tape measure protein
LGVIAEEAVRITADTRGFERDVHTGVTSGIKKIAVGASAALGGLAIGKALFVDPIKSAASFQKSLQILQATSGATNARMKQISATAMKLGADTKLPAVSATDAANAMLALAKGGFTAKQSMDAARGTLLLSTAAEIDGAEAATLVADGLHAFGMRANEAGTLVDDFAGAANASTATMGDVGAALQQSGQAFHQLHIPVGEATTAIAAMANAGIKGSDAGTSLKTMLQRLNPTTVQAKAAMKDMGVHTFDASGRFVGMQSVIEQFGPKLAQMTDKQRQATLATIFGSDAQRAASIILGRTGKSWEDLRDKVTKQGQAQKLADAATKGFDGKMKALRSTLETLQLKIGLALLPKLTTLVTWLGKLASSPSLTVAVHVLWDGIKEFSANVTRVIGDALFGSTRTVHIGGHSTGVVVDPGLIANIGTAISEGIAATNWSVVGKSIGDAISKAIKVSSDAINSMLTGMMNWVNSHKSQIANIGLIIGLTMVSKLLDPGFWIANWRLIGGIALSAIMVMFPEGRLAEVGLRAVGFLLKPFSVLGARLVAVAAEAILRFSAKIEQALGPLAGKIILRIGDALLRVSEWAVARMVQMGADLITAFINKIVGLGVIFRTALSTAVVSVIGNLIGAAVTAAEDLASKIAGGIKTTAGKLEGFAGDVIKKLTGAISQVASEAYTLALSIGGKIVDGVVDGIVGLPERVGKKLISGLQGAKDFAGKALPGSGPFQWTIHTVGQPMAEGILIGFESHITAQRPRVALAIKKLGDEASNATKKELPKIAQNFKDWADAAKAAFDTQVTRVAGMINANFAKVQAQLDKQKAKLTESEAKLATTRALAEAARVDAAVSAARTALESLPKIQEAAWSKLLAQQAKNIATLRATLQSSTDDALLAGNTFAKGMTANASDPLAVTLINAQKAFDATKAQFDAGLVSQEQFIAAANVLDDAKIAAADDANATKLLDDYNTWQQMKAQQAQAGADIQTQLTADEEERKATQAGFDADKLTAQQAFNDAQAASDDFYLQRKAEKERGAQDAEYNRLSAHLKGMHDRAITHVENVQKIWDRHYDKLKAMASTSGKGIADDLAEALRNAIPTVEAAASAVAAAISKHLKVKSPTAAGPMSDLDTWWTRLTPTLLQGFDSAGLRDELGAAVMPDTAGVGINRAAGNGAAGAAYNMARVEALLERIEKNTLTVAQKPDGQTDVHIAAATGIDATAYRARR